MRSASLRASLRLKESTRSFFTQHLRANLGARAAPRLARRTGLLSFASFGCTSGQALRGWCLARLTVTGSDFHSSWGAGHEYLEHSYRFFTFMAHTREKEV
jgi:hypothetical protein